MRRESIRLQARMMMERYATWGSSFIKDFPSPTTRRRNEWLSSSSSSVCSIAMMIKWHARVAKEIYSKKTIPVFNCWSFQINVLLSQPPRVKVTVVRYKLLANYILTGYRRRAAPLFPHSRHVWMWQHERSRTNDLDAEDKKTVDRRRWHTSPALLILDLDYLIPRSVAQGRGFDEIPAKKGGGGE
jgi:hypothetical protein